jgi:hypothetical protein
MPSAATIPIIFRRFRLPMSTSICVSTVFVLRWVSMIVLPFGWTVDELGLKEE